MVKSSLFTKSVRDMRKSLSQFISIFLMAMIAVSIVTGLDSIWKTMENRSEAIYRKTSVADSWVISSNPSETELWKLKRISGVTDVEKRLVLYADTGLPGAPTLQVYGIPQRSRMNLPYVVSKAPVSGSGAILDAAFAEANHLSVGQKIKIRINDIWMEVRIDGLAYHSEHIFSIKDSASLTPSSKAFGFLMVNEDLLKKAFGGYMIYNQISLQLAENADPVTVRQGVEECLGDEWSGIITSKDNRSMNNTASRIIQFRTLSTVFPIMFFVVTALITLSTMLRLVEDQRNQIGILKALGYSKSSITWHYTSYGIYIGILGFLAGLIVGPNIVGWILMWRLKSYYVFPNYHLDLHMTNIVLCFLLIVGCIGGIACYASFHLLREMPSMLLRDKPPKKGNHIVLERIHRLWEHLTFSSKLTARNIFKNKMRMFMSIFGIMGCIGLIVAALTLQTMMHDISENRYENIFTYDQRINLKDASHRFVTNLTLDGVMQDMQETTLEAIAPGGEARMAAITITPSESPLIHLTDEQGNEIRLPETGILITRKLAEILGVKEGDHLRLKLPGEKYQDAEIIHMIYMAANQGIYMSDSFWETLHGDYIPTSLLIKWSGEPDEKFLSSSHVDSSISRIRQKADFKSNLVVVNIAAFMLIGSGCALAFVVIYNMSILNFTERVRDLATLKVLGFYEKEISALVVFENQVSAIVGMILGIPVGKLMSYIIASGFGDDFDLTGRLTLPNIGIALALAGIFTAIVNRIVSRKMKQINMLEALKSVE